MCVGRVRPAGGSSGDRPGRARSVRTVGARLPIGVCRSSEAVNRTRSVASLVAVGLGALVAALFFDPSPAPVDRRPSPAGADSGAVAFSTDAERVRERLRAALLSRGGSPNDEQLRRMARVFLRLQAAQAALLAVSSDAGGVEERRRIRDEIARARADFARVAGVPLSALTAGALDDRPTSHRGRGEEVAEPSD